MHGGRLYRCFEERRDEGFMVSFNAENFANEKVLELITSPCCSEGFLLDLCITRFSA